MSVQNTIQANIDTLPPSSRRVAEALMTNPQLAMEKTISELAVMCNTSETSVVRFCRSIGISGYAELRIALAAEVGQERAQVPVDGRYGTDIGVEDSLADAIGKVAFAERVGIQETLDSLDLKMLDRIIDALDKASRIIVFGIGASNLAAHDLQSKLLRVDRMVISLNDAHDAVALASLARPGDVAIGFSHSGATRETVEFVHAARQHGATTVGITNMRRSPLTVAAELLLYTAVRETTFRSGAMASRTAQLMLVDCIFVGVAQRNFEATVQALKSTRESIVPLRGR